MSSLSLSCNGKEFLTQSKMTKQCNPTFSNCRQERNLICYFSLSAVICCLISLFINLAP